jgi:FAD/FMN-containing dehydrogenase
MGASIMSIEGSSDTDSFGRYMREVPQCTENKSGRQVLRHHDERYVDRVNSYRGTFSYENALRKRRVWVEPLFAEAKDWHGLRRFRLRRLEKVRWRPCTCRIR